MKFLQFMRNLDSSQQVAALFVVVFGLLLLVSATRFALSVRERRVEPSAAQLAFSADFGALLRVTWIMAGVFWLAWAAGPVVATLLFALVAFFSLREFMTLSPTRRGDHRSLVLAFFVVLPVQFWLVDARRFDLFTVFIPVYVFIALPVVSALSGDTLRFLERSAKLQWGIMVCVYGVSHVPALLLLHFKDRPAALNVFLVFFLVSVVQVGMIVQHVVAMRWPRPPFVAEVSASFEWRSWGAGMAAAAFWGLVFSGITPFSPMQGLGLAALAYAAGSMGHLVMKALKRDRGIPAWNGRVRSVTGATGLLDRVDALCFAAPVFFHSVRWAFAA